MAKLHLVSGNGFAAITVSTNNNVGIGTSDPNNKLVVINARCDGNSWINASDRNLKQDFAPVDAQEVLARVTALPIQSWSYKAQPEQKHIGPVAQDFRAALALGPDDTSIATVDADGDAGSDSGTQPKTGTEGNGDNRVESATGEAGTIVKRQVERRRAMKLRGWKMEGGVGPSRSVLECGGKRSATPLWEAYRSKQSERRQSRTATNQPLGCLGCLLLIVFCLPASAQYAINWSTIDGGGGTSTNGQYAVSGTIGQPDAGVPMTNGTYSLTGGFWALPTAVQVEGAPTLMITKGAPDFANISWTPATGTNWLLQERLSLNAISWSNAPSGPTNSIIVPTTVPTKFYRLFKP